MLENENIVEEFKKSLIATVKSIGKNNDLEINFVKENPSIEGNQINLSDPNIDSLQNNLTFIHLFVPHTDIPTSDHIEKFFGMAANSDKQEYSLNLKYTDLLFKHNQTKKNEKIGSF